VKEGWEQKALGEICVVDWGNTNLTKKSYVDGGEFLAVSAAGCDGRIGHKEHAAFTPVLSAIGARCGRMFFPEEAFTAIKNTITLTAKRDKADSKFLYYLLTSIQLPQRGAGQPFISKGDIEKFEIFAPGVPEQRKIVTALDKIFAGLVTATANTEKNLKNASGLFDSYLASIFDAGDARWEKLRLGELSENLDRRRKPITKRDRVAGPFPYYGATGVLDYVEDYLFDEKLILIGEDGAKWGKGEKTAFIAEGQYWVNNHAHVIRPDHQRLIDEWIVYYLNWADLSAYISGLTVPKLNQGKLNEIPIPVPPIGEQQGILSEVNALRSELDTLTEVYNSELELIPELEQAILQQAFSGDMTSLSSIAIREAAQ